MRLPKKRHVHPLSSTSLFFLSIFVCLSSLNAFASTENFQLPSSRWFVEQGSKKNRLQSNEETYFFIQKGNESRKRKPLKIAQAVPHQPPMEPTKEQPKKKKDEITGLTSILNLTASFNLLGLRAIATIGYKWRLYENSKKAFEENYVSINAISQLTPAWTELGGSVAIQPATFIRLQGAYQYRFQLPTFFSGGVFHSAESARNAFANLRKYSEGEQLLRDTIEQRSKDNGGNRILPTSHIASVDLTLRFKVKSIFVLANVRYARWFSSYNLQDKFTAFYEGGHDMLFNADEHFLMVEGGIGYEWKMFRFLAITSFRKAFNANSQYSRVGPAFQWIIAPKWGGFKNPSLLTVVNWYLLHEWRGHDGIPLVAMRFGGEF